ncbi:endogenous retrovirus group K member 21 Gag polyprotein-like [Meriones unguiculatus]|uniref:endogenous retrovirus group K member 21 Gag polyprotein-like n=1 Tax=Meriones unguiculatus TaxID=10047 RepID=UPI00293E021E|nr:endogenous retrovirus group K member 21 Gag polyprotein-like [Meriones unguiculatus]
MGHSLSKEASFVKELKASLRERGIRVKKKDLVNFFLFIDKVCPWFMIDGPTIHPKKWQKVGRELNQKLAAEGNDALSPTVFSFWGIIRDIVEDADNDTDNRQLLLVAEFCLASSTQNSPVASQPPSRPPSCPPSRASASLSLIDASVSNPSSLPQLYPPPLPSASVYEPPPYKSPPLINPVLKKPKPKISPLPPQPLPSQDTDPLDPGDATTFEDEAAHYHDDDPPLASAPPAPFPATVPPTLPTFPTIPSTSLSEIRSRLSAQVRDLTEIHHLQQQLSCLTTRCSAFTNPFPSIPPILPPPEPSPVNPPINPASTQTPPQLAFPVTTRSQTCQDRRSGSLAAPRASTPLSTPLPQSEADGSFGESETDDNEDEGIVNRDSPVGEPGDYRRLHFKKLEKLNSAVRTYGPNAPFTISLLESMAEGGFLTPGEWLTGKYASEQVQQGFPLGLLAQAHGAALAAWRAIPVKGSVLSPLTKIIQGSNEDYSEFFGRLLEAAERTLGPDKIEQKENKLLKQLAFENANSACKAALRGKHKDKDLPDMIHLCQEVDTFTHKMSQAINLVMGAPAQPSGSKFSCCKCGQTGHFARQCPQQEASGLRPQGQPQALSQTGATRPLPTTVCPRCRRGKHWANTCRSQMDISGNPLPPRAGNMLRGQPQTPQPINFLPASGISQPCHDQVPIQSVPGQSPAFAGQPPGVQDWTSVPPPTQF